MSGRVVPRGERDYQFSKKSSPGHMQKIVQVFSLFPPGFWVPTSCIVAYVFGQKPTVTHERRLQFLMTQLRARMAEIDSRTGAYKLVQPPVLRGDS